MSPYAKCIWWDVLLSSLDQSPTYGRHDYCMLVWSNVKQTIRLKIDLRITLVTFIKLKHNKINLPRPGINVINIRKPVFREQLARFIKELQFFFIRWYVLTFFIKNGFTNAFNIEAKRNIFQFSTEAKYFCYLVKPIIKIVNNSQKKFWKPFWKTLVK